MARYAGGWFKAWREAWSKDLSDNLVLWGVWNAFLHMATWKDSQIIWQGRQRVIPAGTVVFGVSELADKWGVSKSTISRWVRYLVSTERIRYESGTDGSLATILNWETYQAQVEASETLAEHKLDADRTRSEREVALNEEGKKERREEGSSSVSVSTAPTAEVWEAYRAAYLKRHGADPTRNKTVNSQLKGFTNRVPAGEAAEIAAFYVRHNDQFYVRNLHPVGLLLKDAEKLRTEWLTGRTMTGTQAKHAEKGDYHRQQMQRILEGKV